MIAEAGFSTKRFLMGLAFAASFGGTMTLIGTPPKGVVEAVLTRHTPSFGFFEFAEIGLPIAVVGILSMLFVGVRFLPKGLIDTSGEDYEGPKLDKPFRYRKEKVELAVGLFIFIIFT